MTPIWTLTKSKFPASLDCVAAVTPVLMFSRLILCRDNAASGILDGPQDSGGLKLGKAINSEQREKGQRKQAIYEVLLLSTTG
jgi:hypothetical protein